MTASFRRCSNPAGLCLLAAAAWTLAGSPSSAADPAPLADVLQDENFQRSEFWVYNNIPAAFAEARRTGKPLFVTFRCVPCQACKGFDAEVAAGAGKIKELADEHFVAVRQVEMKGVDLSQFQFDYDLNWAAMFLNADGTVYARYGTQSAAGPDAYNSIEGLVNTMRRVLELHDEYPANKAVLAGKRGPDMPYHTALDMPGMANKEHFVGATARNNCIHCHNIHDAENRHAAATGITSNDLLWRFPLPENLGLVIDADHGRRIDRIEPGSPAAESGLKVDEEVTHVGGQVITSIADIQWVLDHLPNSETTLDLRGSRTGEHTLQLAPGWKKTDISWRGSIWSVSPILRTWMPELTNQEKRERGLPVDQPAFDVRWINRGEAGGKAIYKAGLREGDTVVAFNGETIQQQKSQQFMAHIKLNYSVGDRITFTVLRDGLRKQIEIPLVE